MLIKRDRLVLGIGVGLTMPDLPDDAVDNLLREALNDGLSRRTPRANLRERVLHRARLRGRIAAPRTTTRWTSLAFSKF